MSTKPGFAFQGWFGPRGKTYTRGGKGGGGQLRAELGATPRTPRSREEGSAFSLRGPVLLFVRFFHIKCVKGHNQKHASEF